MKKLKFIVPALASVFLFAACDTPEYPEENAVTAGTVNGVFVGNSVSATIDGETVTAEPVSTEIPGSFMRGFDASAVNDSAAMEYFDENGNKKDIFLILKQYGVNYVRLRVWNNPDAEANPSKPGASDKNVVVQQSVRAKKAGLKVLLDFHYSDYWADPGKQLIPESWLGAADSDEMAKNISDYTKEVLNALKSANALPDMIQIGNEINPGILVHKAVSKDESSVTAADEGISGSFNKANFAKYIGAGISAAKEVSPASKIMLHIAGTSTRVETILNAVKNAGFDFDVIGLSWYPKENHGTISVLGSKIASLKAAYGKEVVVAETNMNWKTDKVLTTEKNNLTVGGKLYDGILSDSDGNITVSIQNQSNVIRGIIEVTAKNGGSGVFVWGGEYRGAWNSMFAGNGKPLPSMAVFGVQGK